jgi:hypothetical protein
VTLRDSDNCRTIDDAGIGIVDDHGSPDGERRVDQLLLSTLRLAVVAHDILADVLMGRSQSFAVERRLAGPR